jgi:hypothetical protein
LHEIKHVWSCIPNSARDKHINYEDNKSKIISDKKVTLPIDRVVALPVTQEKGTRQLRNSTFSQFHGRTRNLMAAKKKR